MIKINDALLILFCFIHKKKSVSADTLPSPSLKNGSLGLQQNISGHPAYQKKNHSCFLTTSLIHYKKSCKRGQGEINRIQLVTGGIMEGKILPSTRLNMSLKPAALPLLDCGKALARSGELLIDVTNELNIYGGALSAAGAGIRNAGDCVAQAAASCRFKTGTELVCDELREAAICLNDSTNKLRVAVQESDANDNKALAKCLEGSIVPISTVCFELEAIGACIMKRSPLLEIGSRFVEGGTSLIQLSSVIANIMRESDNARLSSERMRYAGEKMQETGRELTGIPKEKPKGKSWLKGM